MNIISILHVHALQQNKSLLIFFKLMAQLTLLLRKAKRSNETKLDLSGRQISFLPNDIYSLTKLQILNLSNNKIITLDEKINELKNLKVLDLSGNSLSDLPKQMLQLQNLQALILDGNPLSKQFQPLLEKNASLDIQKSIKRCFGLQSGSAPSIPNWFQSQKVEEDTNNKTIGKMVQLQNKYKKQQQKVKQLQKQLQKLSMRQKKDNSNMFNLQLQSILQINFKDLQIFQQISMGGFSTIHRGSYKGLQVAVKKVFNPKINQQLIQQLSNQINMLAKFRHPNIVLLVGICSQPPNLAIVTQYVQSGSLYDLIHKKKVKLSNQQRKNIIKQILGAVNYLHQHGIVHRDIKSHNFLIYQNYTVKLCDFGLARSKQKLHQGPMQFSGTPVYMAQQLFQKKSYDEKVDIFAIGTLLYQIYTGQIPYNKLDPADIKDKLLKDSNLSSLSIEKPILEIINRCRNVDSNARPTSSQLYKRDQW